MVVDLGANTGNFSRLSHRLGSKVVSIDSSHGCIDQAYKDLKQYPDLLPLIIDLSNPCTGVGWNSMERPPIQNRVCPDLVLALALIHHLAISNALPFGYLVQFFEDWNCPILIEFVPKSDPQVPLLYPGGNDVFPNYTEQKFSEAFSTKFKICGTYPIEDSTRVLYYLVPNKSKDTK
jgi:hypothetical protein